ncbi:MAG: malate dehydrogenase [Candidatus Omnitrophica bacterium]|nr:malate dehydrogenase [Candidatus Omnitrophota bacterium]
MSVRKKVSVIGAGNVGSTLAMRIVEARLADVVLVDVVDGLAEGKALDMMHAASITGTDKRVVGTTDYSAIKGSDVVVMTAGLPRKPGMSREELISKNAEIVRGVASKIKEFAPKAILIMVTNPLDLMTYLAQKITGFNPERVFGMAGLLDVARFKYLLSEELKKPASSIEAFIVGSHSDKMVPVAGVTTVGKKPLRDLLPREKVDEVIAGTRTSGAKVVSLLGKGSAYYAPSAAAYKMAEAVLNDNSNLFCASAYLRGEYGLKDIYIGVPAKIGRGGIEEILEVELTEEEKSDLKESADGIRDSLKKVGL